MGGESNTHHPLHDCVGGDVACCVDDWRERLQAS